MIEKTNRILRFSHFGDPCSVLELATASFKERTLKEVGKKNVIVRWLATPINPADINLIQGTYGVKPDNFPCVAGNEGVGEVLKSECDKLKEGDWVIPSSTQLGVWRDYSNIHSENLIKVDKRVGMLNAATIGVNPCTSYRLLQDYGALQPGDSVIFNAANSSVGKNLVKLAKKMGIKSICILRDRSHYADVENYLKKLGADLIIKEDELGKSAAKEKIIELGKPKVAFDAVGGTSSLDMTRALRENGKLVIYGGMSRKPLTLPISPFIFKNLSVEGFWLSRWIENPSHTEAREKMIHDLCRFILEDSWSSDCQEFSPQEYKDALRYAMEPYHESKAFIKKCDLQQDFEYLRHGYKKIFKQLVLQAVQSIENDNERQIERLITLGEEKHHEESGSIKQTLPREASRYIEDFIELDRLGKGAFGCVFKARNRLDQNEYAVKKIKFRAEATDETKIFREIKSLAKLDHVNIVRYHSAWIELGYEDDDDSEDEEDYSDSSSTSSSHSSSTENCSMMLFIQMQLCFISLKSWIQLRNRIYSGSNDVFCDKNVEHFIGKCIHRYDGVAKLNSYENVRIFKHIVRGVVHIHSNGLIHRDLKPENILFGDFVDWIPKIGDFGLVTDLKNDQLLFKTRKVSGEGEEITSGVGTVTYASPEQLNATMYNEKVDIYSLGIIFLELFCPFNSEMERAKVITELRTKSILPSWFVQEMPKEAAFILWSTASDPDLRPSAQEILELDLLDTSEELLTQLNQRLFEKDSEIVHLKSIIYEQNKEIEKLKSQINA